MCISGIYVYDFRAQTQDLSLKLLLCQNIIRYFVVGTWCESNNDRIFLSIWNIIIMTSVSYNVKFKFIFNFYETHISINCFEIMRPMKGKVLSVYYIGWSFVLLHNGVGLQMYD